MPISRHMLCQLVYPFCEQGYLNLGRAGVFFTAAKFAYELGLLLFVQIISLHPLVILANINYTIKLTDYSISASRCKLA
jgi:hypothetical protein